ncbi:MAG: NusG domain II-containing protein [Oscillospiraceae bacterium]
MKNSYFKKKEILIIAALVLVSAAAILCFKLIGGRGNVAVVTYNGGEVMRIDLSNDGIYSVDADLPVSLEVSDGKIHFINSQCPDKLCEGFGLIGEEFEYAVCMPARVSVQIVKN